ncbi:Demethylmenaquinone methyltransferase-domain-containing protein [Scenedesmus sp. NREL 46B-D3]|nr:Demethylmenaquinone methyltransferase-domain-containing protein [Scenedesmus sp. NREL 46B-D3]
MITIQALVLLRPAAACGRAAPSLLRAFAAAAAEGPKTATPPPDASRGATADLADVFIPEPVDQVSMRKVQIMEPVFQDLGGKLRFSGQVSTVKCFESNPLVRKAFEQPGKGRVLVVDGGGSKRCALLGDNIAEMAHKNGWNGAVIYGCIRDSEDIGKMPLGVKALGTYPLKSAKRDVGLADVPVTIAGVSVEPGDWVYADKDGILVSKEELKL